MKRLLYISPSVFPSTAANSTHVILQVDALTHFFEKVYIIGMVNPLEENAGNVILKIREKFDVKLRNVSLLLCRNPLKTANNFVIALYSVWFLLKLRDIKLITRNIYAASLAIKLFKSSFIYETHTIENGFRGIIQKNIVNSKKTEIVVISNSLKKLILEKYKIDANKIHVLHDAARSNLPLITNRSRKIFPVAKPFLHVVGYFGSLLPGRGVEVIEKIAQKMKNVLFVVYGPSGQNLEFEKKVVLKHSNIHFGGFLDHRDVNFYMACCDVLLMPYQHKVSIDGQNSDTSKFMSPMKMFEYMASGVPIVSSDLTVLNEVLKNGYNCLLVDPTNIEGWVRAIKILTQNKSMAANLALKAREQYCNEYNWESRATSLISILNAKEQY